MVVLSWLCIDDEQKKTDTAQSLAAHVSRLNRKVLKNDMFSTRVSLILDDHKTGYVRKLIFLAFYAYEERPTRSRTCHVCRFEGKMS
jgi:hypothetical protein